MRGHVTHKTSTTKHLHVIKYINNGTNARKSISKLIKCLLNRVAIRVPEVISSNINNSFPPSTSSERVGIA